MRLKNITAYSFGEKKVVSLGLREMIIAPTDDAAIKKIKNMPQTDTPLSLTEAFELYSGKLHELALTQKRGATTEFRNQYSFLEYISYLNSHIDVSTCIEYDFKDFN